MKKALFWSCLKGRKVKCELCPRFCMISEGKTGYCKVRQNQKGRLFSLVYGRPCSFNPDPIEKKPLFHFAPGTQCLSLSTVGCNLECLHCQNWEISHPEAIFGRELLPEEVVKYTRDNKLPGIAYTYTEPAVFLEYALDTMKLAKKAGLYNIWVSNGYINPEPAREAAKYLDAINIDLKGDNGFYKKVCGVPDNKPVLEAMKLFKKAGVFLEVTNLIIPGYNDSEKQIKTLVLWVKKNLGPDTPLHFSRFYPCYKMENIKPTPEKTLNRAWGIAAKAGMHYVYVGNAPGHPKENTLCPKCGTIAIKRTGYHIEYVRDKCKCGEKIPIAGKRWLKL